MNKLNFTSKKFKQRFLSINNSIESYFNKFKSFKSNFKKNNIIRNNRVFFGTAAVVILTLSYFLLPTLYNKDIIQVEIKNQILKKYNIDVKFNEKIRYGLLPKPHFIAKNLSIFREKNEIAVVGNFKVFFKVGNFFSYENLEFKNLHLKDTDFNINKEDFVFFENLLKTEPNDNNIVFKKSNIFFNNYDDELLFLNKIKSSEFYYDSINLENVLVSKNEIFNIPYKLTIKNNKFKKELIMNFNSKKIRLSIENKINYSDEIKKGLIDLLFVNKKKSLNYDIKKNSLNFSSEDKKTLNGFLDFKPFFLKSNLKYDGISTKNMFDYDSVLVELIKTEILNNQNLNVNINLKIQDITNIDELNKLDLMINLEQGEIIFSRSKIFWKDDLEIVLNEGLLNYDENEIFLNGKLVINAKNIDDFYKSFQIKKADRKKIKKIELDFVYNFDKNKFLFDNIRIDNNSDENLNRFIDDYNSNEKKFFNKVTFKNFINNFFSNYEG